MFADKNHSFANALLLAAIFFLSTIFLAINGEKGQKLPKWTPGYVEAANPPKDGKKIFYADDGTCGWLDAQSGKYVKPKMNMTSFNFKCLHQFFEEAFVPVCGNPWYSRIKYCAMVYFYDNKLPEKSDVLAGDKSDLALILVDGCAICAKQSANEMEISITVNYKWPAGSFFTDCHAVTKSAGKMKVKLKSDEQKVTRKFPNMTFGSKNLYGHFTVPTIFYQRECQGLFSPDTVLESFDDVWMEIEHNCGGSGKTMNIKLEPVKPKEHKGHVVELRGLMLLLDSGVTRQFNHSSREYLDETPKWSKFAKGSLSNWA